MKAIDDIRSVLKYRKDMGLPEVKLIGMSVDKLNTLYLDFQEEFHPLQLGNPNIESRLLQVNAIMRDRDLPEIALLQ